MYRLTAFFRTMKTGSSPPTNYMELAPGSHWQSEPHLRGTTEFVTLFAGAIEITADQKAIVVQAGESVRFQGDTTHAYRNISDQTTTPHMTLYNP